MSRLTDKDCYKYEDFCFNYRNRETMQSGADFAMYAKLKSLEDLEEKIGIDLICLIICLFLLFIPLFFCSSHFVFWDFIFVEKLVKRQGKTGFQKPFFCCFPFDS